MTKHPFNAIGIIGKHGDPSVIKTLTALTNYLVSQQLQVIMDDDTARIATFPSINTGTITDIGQRCDIAIVVGGDGTLLNSARALIDYKVPLVGINLGRLGFLTDITPQTMIDYLGDILIKGDYLMEERSLLHCSVIREGKSISESDAFNDVVIHKWNIARMIELETHINGSFVNLQRLDGLIIATPTGSTAYALSAGGPILHPLLDAFAIVPVCPHTLTSRPIVVESNSIIKVVVCESNQTNTQVTCDGQVTYGLVAGDQVEIRKKERTVRLIHPPRHDHYEVLRAKLRWSENPHGSSR
jgi:NAD+ kinase